MMRNDINIAIVTMVRTAVNETAESAVNATEAKAETGEFEWSTRVQSVILGSFYCFYVLSQVRSIAQTIVAAIKPANY